MIATQLACLTLVSLLLGQLDTSAAADCKYRIRTKTGNQLNAGTDADVSIKLSGSAATCGWRQLDTPANDFEQGK
ncbi:hypothetical protein LSAT2_002722 [Lamellibrachia satsuma]|nr:hypothetical protein LSAT2_002722 [Lamellibrachia satsuma]